MSACLFPMVHQYVYDRSYRPVGHYLRAGRRHDFVERLKLHPAKARGYVDIITNEMLLRAQISALQPGSATGCQPAGNTVLYFVECDVLALLQELKVTELQEAAKTLRRRKAILVLRLYDDFQSLLLRGDRALFTEALCLMREQGIRIAVGASSEPGQLVRLLQRLGCIDYLFLSLSRLPPATTSAIQARHIGEMRDLMVEQINANRILFVASGMDTEYANELAQFLPFTYWIGSYLSAAERI